MPGPFPHQVTVLWGECPQPEDRPSTYSFETEAEVHAFLLGCAEMEGWMGYRVIEDGEMWCPECQAITNEDEDGFCASCNEEEGDDA